MNKLGLEAVKRRVNASVGKVPGVAELRRKSRLHYFRFLYSLCVLYVLSDWDLVVSADNTEITASVVLLYYIQLQSS